MRKFSLLTLCLLAGCNFTPLYSTTQNPSVCVASIPEHDGYVLYNILTDRFTGKSDCKYTLKVEKPKFSFSNSGISDHSFTTMQTIEVETSYELQDAKHKPVLKSSSKAAGTSAVINDPYATVVSRETTQEDLLKILAGKIETHISSFLLKDAQ